MDVKDTVNEEPVCTVDSTDSNAEVIPLKKLKKSKSFKKDRKISDNLEIIDAVENVLLGPENVPKEFELSKEKMIMLRVEDSDEKDENFDKNFMENILVQNQVQDPSLLLSLPLSSSPFTDDTFQSMNKSDASLSSSLSLPLSQPQLTGIVDSDILFENRINDRKEKYGNMTRDPFEVLAVKSENKIQNEDHNEDGDNNDNENKFRCNYEKEDDYDNENVISDYRQITIESIDLKSKNNETDFDTDIDSNGNVNQNGYCNDKNGNTKRTSLSNGLRAGLTLNPTYFNTDHDNDDNIDNNDNSYNTDDNGNDYSYNDTNHGNDDNSCNENNRNNNNNHDRGNDKVDNNDSSSIIDINVHNIFVPDTNVLAVLIAELEKPVTNAELDEGICDLINGVNLDDTVAKKDCVDIDNDDDSSNNDDKNNNNHSNGNNSHGNNNNENNNKSYGYVNNDDNNDNGNNNNNNNNNNNVDDESATYEFVHNCHKDELKNSDHLLENIIIKEIINIQSEVELEVEIGVKLEVERILDSSVIVGIAEASDVMKKETGQSTKIGGIDEDEEEEEDDGEEGDDDDEEEEEEEEEENMIASGDYHHDHGQGQGQSKDRWCDLQGTEQEQQQGQQDVISIESESEEDLEHIEVREE